MHMRPLKCDCGDTENCRTCRHRERMRAYRDRDWSIKVRIERDETRRDVLFRRGLLPFQIEQLRLDQISEARRLSSGNRHRTSPKRGHA